MRSHCPAHINRAIKDQKLVSVPLKVMCNYWEDPVLHGQISQLEDWNWIEPTTRALQAEVPIFPLIPGKQRGDIFRLPQHKRTFYFKPSNVGARGVIAVKGAEPLAPDLEPFLQHLANVVPGVASSQPSLLEHFAILEEKVPGGLTANEAYIEAGMAAEVQRKHYRHFGCFSRLPIPLLILAHSSSTTERLQFLLETRLSSRGLETLPGLLKGGLAIYVYYYPSIPLRLSQLNTALAGCARAKRGSILAFCDLEPLELINRWVTTFSRVLLLGYCPVSLNSAFTGNCCNAGNAVLDGGFTDLDSLIATNDITSDSDLERTLALSLTTLTETALRLLSGRLDDPRVSRLLQTSLLERITDWCSSCVEEQEVFSGLKLDRRITAYFDAHGSDECLQTPS